MAKAPGDVAERMLALSVIDFEIWFEGTPCWIWIGATNGTYGKIDVHWRSGPRKGKRRTALAHRLSLEVFKGRRLSTRSVAKHLCNTPLCINPDHLRGGTQSSNIRQCVAEGRHYTPFRKQQEEGAPA